MKMKIIIASILAFGMLASCELIGDIDSIKPEHQLEEENVASSATKVELMLNGIYEGWRQIDVSKFRAHGSALSGSLIITGNITGSQEFVSNSILPDNFALTNWYTNLYAIVNSANMLIVQLENGKAPDLKPKRRTEILAECKMQRSMAWFYLLRTYSSFYNSNSRLGIVITKEPFREATQIPRSTVKEAYSAILEDLSFAVTNLPQATKHYRLSIAAALSFKAKLMLYMKDYQQAESVAKQAIEAAEADGYKLENTYGDIFIKGYNSEEVLFAPYTFGISESMPFDYRRVAYGTETFKLADLLLDGTANGNHSTGEGLDARFSITFRNSSGTKAPLGKYPHNDNVMDVCGNTFFHLRLAEVYLIHAEAAARNSHYTEARQSLQVVLSRAGYSENQSTSFTDNELLDAIRKHKWIELVSENYEEWFDMIRYYSEGDLSMSDLGKIKSTIANEKQLILPIPQNALAGNSKLEQNPL